MAITSFCLFFFESITRLNFLSSIKSKYHHSGLVPDLYKILITSKKEEKQILRFEHIEQIQSREDLLLNLYSGYKPKIITQVAQKAFSGRSYGDSFTATWFHISNLLLLSRGLDDVNELRLQGSSTNQKSIHVWLCCKFFAVCSIHRTSIYNSG